MTCITTVYAQGGLCENGGPAGNWGTHVFQGRWSQTTVTSCGRQWVGLKDSNGDNHPNSNYYAFHPTGFTLTVSGCSVPGNEQFDCINGGCVPKTTYSTPGVFASLAACQSGCAKNSSCTGECISKSEIAALQAAANNLMSRYCK